MKKTLFELGLLLIFLQSCNNSDDNSFQDSICEQITIVNSTTYKNINSEGFSIKNIQLNDHCLEIEIESGGCDGSSWKVDLIDADRVAETATEQRDLKISLDNSELCNAIIFKTFTFDLRPTQIGKNKVLLNLELWNEQILYEY